MFIEYFKVNSGVRKWDSPSLDLTELVLFTEKNTENVQATNYLGAVFVSKLTFKSHIEELIRKATAIIWL